MAKTYVKVTAEHDELGKVRPLVITWTDGKRYEVDKLLDVRLAPSIKGGGLGMRYTCRVMGKEFYLFEESGRWFVEK